MAARVVQLRNAMAAMIEAAWSPTPPDEVIPTFRYDVYTESIHGRKVIVFPEAYSGSPETRGGDSTDYGYQVWIVRRYEEQGDPPDEWVAAELEFVESVANLFDPRTLLLGADPESGRSGAYPQEADVTTVYDVVDLIEQKLFISVITVLLREDA